MGKFRLAARWLALAAPAWVLLVAMASAQEDASEARRVVSLAPHLTELVFAVGAGERLVGVVEWSDFPPEARDLPRIGDAFRFDLERVLALDADLALSWAGGTPDGAVARLEDVGIEVHPVEIRSLDDIAGALESLGRLLGEPAAGNAAAERFRQRRQAFSQRQAGGPEVPVFYQVSARPLYTVGGRHVINEVLALCGARNVFAGLDTEAAVVARESVLAAEPLALIAGTDGDDDPLGHWRRDHDDLPAVACGNLLAVEPELLVRPTPRILDGAARLCDWLKQVRRAEDPACEIGRR